LMEKPNEAGFVIVIPLAPVTQIVQKDPSFNGAPRNIT